MARIPTYDSQVTQVVAQKEFHVDSTASAVASGLTQGIKGAANMVGAVSDYHRVQERQQQALEKADLEADTAKIYDADNNTLNDLGVAQAEIQEQYRNAPNLQKMNDALKDKYNTIVQKYAEGLTPAGAEHYLKLANSELQNRMRQNETFYKTRSAALAKSNELKLANTIDTNIDNDVIRAGLMGEPYSNIGINIKEGGRYELSPDEALLPESAKKKAASISNKYYLAALDRPVLDQYDENGDLAFPGIVSSDKLQIPFDIYNGAEQEINDYYDNIVAQADANPNLSASQKNKIANQAEAQKIAKMRQFDRALKGEQERTLADFLVMPDSEILEQAKVQKTAPTANNLSEKASKQIQVIQAERAKDNAKATKAMEKFYKISSDVPVKSPEEEMQAQQLYSNAMSRNALNNIASLTGDPALTPGDKFEKLINELETIYKQNLSDGETEKANNLARRALLDETFGSNLKSILDIAETTYPSYMTTYFQDPNTPNALRLKREYHKQQNLILDQAITAVENGSLADGKAIYVAGMRNLYRKSLLPAGIDIDELERQKNNGETPIFFQNGQPMEFKGFASNGEIMSVPAYGVAPDLEAAENERQLQIARNAALAKKSIFDIMLADRIPIKTTVNAVKSSPNPKTRTQKITFESGNYLTKNESRMYNAFGDVSTFKDFYDKYKSGEFTQEDADKLGITKERAENAFKQVDVDMVMKGYDETKALETEFLSFDVKGIV